MHGVWVLSPWAALRSYSLSLKNLIRALSAAPVTLPNSVPPLARTTVTPDAPGEADRQVGKGHAIGSVSADRNAGFVVLHGVAPDADAVGLPIKHGKGLCVAAPAGIHHHAPSTSTAMFCAHTPAKFTVNVVMGTLYTLLATTYAVAVCSMLPSLTRSWYTPLGTEKVAESSL